jgi:type IV pilus assembly protein PilE
MHKYIRKKGFTLIELMVAVAIVGILAAIAIPSYQESMRKSRRADAQSALLNIANAMERYFTQNNTYCDTGTSSQGAVVAADTCGGAANDTGFLPGAIDIPRGETRVHYDIFVSTAPPGGNNYTLRATPVAGGRQVGDGMIELDSTGLRRWDRNDDGDFTDARETSWDLNR